MLALFASGVILPGLSLIISSIKFFEILCDTHLNDFGIQLPVTFHFYGRTYPSPIHFIVHLLCLILCKTLRKQTAQGLSSGVTLDWGAPSLETPFKMTPPRKSSQTYTLLIFSRNPLMETQIFAKWPPPPLRGGSGALSYATAPFDHSHYIYNTL